MQKALIPGLLATFAAVGLLQLAACTEGDNPATTGMAGTGASTTGGAGTGAAAGTTGTAGTTNTGVAGTSVDGTGAAGTGAAAGTSGGGAGTSAAGSTGTAGTGSNPGGKNYPTGNSAGCDKEVTDLPNQWVEHKVTVTVPAAYQAMFTNRRYFTRLPTNYDPSKPYPVIVWGQGCGATMAEPTPVTNSDAVNYIQVFMLQVSGCFNTGPADSPDIDYFDAALKGTQDDYCTDKGRVFMGGFSSGSWLTHMLGCHRATSLRGVGSASGGIGGRHHDCTGPVAAILTADTTDKENPIIATDAATGLPKGSAAARDRLLMENGCSLTETKPWDAAFPACVAYQNCNPLYPVVWCETTGMGHSNGGMYSSRGFWKFWSSLLP
jgi:poly(3-hydroxybutyrate) depolymerase